MIAKAERIFKELNLEDTLKKKFVSDRLSYSRLYRYCLLPSQAARLWPLLDFSKFLASKSASISKIYISVPFCINSCFYCSINRDTRKRYPIPPQNYPAYLKKEISLFKRYIAFKALPIKYVHFGGGTPTVLGVEQLIEIVDDFKDAFNFCAEANISTESHPNSIIGLEGIKKLRILRDFGFNRISIGIQEMDDSILRIAGRSHVSKGNIEALNNAREAGFKEINIDLMCGLPGQTLHNWCRTISRVIELVPDGVELFRLRFDTSVPPMFRMILKRPQIFPSLKDILLMHIIAKENFAEAGYVEYAPGTFRKKGNGPAAPLFNPAEGSLGFGVGAIGVCKDAMCYNYCSSAYFKKLDKNILPVRNIYTLSYQQIMRKYIISCLCMLEEGLSRRSFLSEFGADIETIFRRPFSLLAGHDLISRHSSTVKLTYKGALFADDIFKLFWPPRWLDMAAPEELAKSRLIFLNKLKSRLFYEKHR